MLRCSVCKTPADMTMGSQLLIVADKNMQPLGCVCPRCTLMAARYFEAWFLSNIEKTEEAWRFWEEYGTDCPAVME